MVLNQTFNIILKKHKRLQGDIVILISVIYLTAKFIINIPFLTVL